MFPGRPLAEQQKRPRVECELAAPLNESKGFYKSNKRTQSIPRLLEGACPVSCQAFRNHSTRASAVVSEHQIDADSS
jgi:hypothetical protein